MSGAIVLLVAAAGVWAYRTTIPADPFDQAGLVYAGSGLSAKPGQTLALVGWLATRHRVGVVFDASPVAYPGLRIHMMTTSSIPTSAGAEIIPEDASIFPPSTLEPLQAQRLRPPDAHVGGHGVWWIPIVAVIDVRRPGCWRLAVPLRYHIGSTRFSHLAGGFTLRTGRCSVVGTYGRSA
ncbi:MAG TPA: hypothetical protein VFW14_00845 [Gaiellales bacterium]|nr:hypothetical protein [Gaiellales bacterium]